MKKHPVILDYIFSSVFWFPVFSPDAGPPGAGISYMRTVRRRKTTGLLDFLGFKY